jgi:large subunit ribosomal protein L25
MKKFELKAEKRTVGNAKLLRKESKLPCEIYAKGIENQHLSLDLQDFIRVYRKAGESNIINLNLDGKNLPVIIHDIQFDPVTGIIIHVDFSAIQEDREIHAHIPVHLNGKSDAVKILHGILMQQKDTLEVKCLPKDLPSEILVDISVIKDFHTTITVKDLDLPKSVIVLDNEDSVIVNVAAPKLKDEQEPSEEAGEEEGGEEEKAEEKSE